MAILNNEPRSASAMIDEEAKILVAEETDPELKQLAQDEITQLEEQISNQDQELFHNLLTINP